GRWPGRAPSPRRARVRPCARPDDSVPLPPAHAIVTEDKSHGCAEPYVLRGSPRLRPSRAQAGAGLPCWSPYCSDRESELSEDFHRAGLPALEVTGGKAPARYELVSCTQDCFGRVAAFLPDQLVRRGRGETMLRKELFRAQSVVLAYRA